MTARDSKEEDGQSCSRTSSSAQVAPSSSSSWYPTARLGRSATQRQRTGQSQLGDSVAVTTVPEGTPQQLVETPVPVPVPVPRDRDGTPVPDLLIPDLLKSGTGDRGPSRLAGIGDAPAGGPRSGSRPRFAEIAAGDSGQAVVVQWDHGRSRGRGLKLVLALP